jgi:serine protease Do
MVPMAKHVATLAVALTGLLVSGLASGQTRPRTTGSSTPADLSIALETTARTAGPAVVEIFTTTYAPGAGVLPRSADLITPRRASGSGVIVDSAGFIVTNAHVVRGAERLRVELPRAVAGRSILPSTGRSVAAEIVGLDLETDLAVLKVNEQNLPTVPFGDSDDLRPGQLVLALGSPLGLRSSVTLGVISSVARQLEPESPMIYVQTDASINAGSSGGPLVNLRGELVGINTLIASQTGGYEGVGFAAPSNIVRTVYEQIKAAGRVRRGDIGIRTQTVTPSLAAGLRLARDVGVVIADVLPRSPAAVAGLRIGDLILDIDGKVMENGRQVQVNLYRRRVGEVVSLEILRGDQVSTYPVAVAERDDPLSELSASADARQSLVPRLGILGLTLDSRIASMVPVSRVTSGIVIVSTVAGAIDTRDGGLAPGDVVYAINRTPVASLAELRAALDRLSVGDPVVLHLERRGELMYLAFTVE